MRSWIPDRRPLSTGQRSGAGGRNGKRFWRAWLLISTVALWAPPGWAQDQSLPTASPLAPSPPRWERVGVDPSRTRPLSLHDAILMALQKNRDIEIERINGQLAEYQLTSARGAYDPVLSSRLLFESATTPVGSVLAGGATGSVSTDTYIYNVSVRQALPGGGNYQLSLENTRLSSSNVFITLNPQYGSVLRLTFTQPLLRNLGLDATRRAIRLAQKRLDLSDAEFRQRVIHIINQVQRAYWDLVFAHRHVQVQQESVDWARKQLAMNRRMVEAGTLAPVEIIAAEAELKRREELLLTAIEGVTIAENGLKALILDGRTDPLWAEAIWPTESGEIEPLSLDLAEAVRLALSSRPEMMQFQLHQEMNEVDIGYFRNQTRPQIDFVGSYATHGLAGRVRAGENPFSQASLIILDRVNQLSELAGLPPISLPPPGRLPQFLTGGQAQAWSNLLSNDFRTVQVGVSISLPLRNRTAQAQLGQALAERRLIQAQRAKLEQAIEVDVRNALQAVQTARKRVEAARAACLAAKANLESEERRYEAGETTNFFVLTRQNELSAAQSQEVRALMDYNKAIAELQRATATTLSASNISVEPPRTTP